MRNFLLYLSKATLVLLMFLSPILWIYNQNMSSNLQKLRRGGYDNEEVIILGSSHGRDGIHNGIIENSYNLSSSGFTLEESFKELIRLKDIQSPINTVIISFSPFSLHKTNSEPKKTNVVFDFEEYGENLLLNFFRNPNRKEFVLSTKFMNPQQIKTQYYKTQGSDEKIKIDGKTEYFSHASFKDYFGLKYLEQISDFCSKNNIRLIFVVFPFSSVYNEYLSLDQTWNEDLKLMKNRSNYFEFYDFSRFFDFEPLDSKYFTDGSHLNSSGGLIFTKYIKEKILFK